MNNFFLKIEKDNVVYFMPNRKKNFNYSYETNLLKEHLTAFFAIENILVNEYLLDSNL